MQQHQPNLFPVPDVGRVPSARSRFPARPSSSPSAPNFIIVGLFALRLAKRLLEGLEYYPGRDADIIWLVNFLAPFSDDYPLAKISGRQKDDYLQMYPALVSRMKKQPRYPIRFMQMNPDQSMYQSRQCGVAEQPKKMTDVKRLETIDFCDAANEWGSSVPIPACEAERMIELANQRRIADLDRSQRREEGQHTSARRPHFESTTFSPDERTRYMNDRAKTITAQPDIEAHLSTGD
ncbi:hypothetical protein COCC4DRAFT_36662 [Bipolaris maydis ATCC 48331]|uniref:Uncharacterized protein n=1 Tax=Cochliobolus heterostrophus (strain C4 / ATCC 48331 / race T) TaxID=665024 RepID=N4XBQ4_COCH4|nr:uncharacterized protein COCC4DRAFT_36662 [Bipolaris maydis ATCC 48331]ENI09055.1 hypothetical protein COCC4DRAFT_36662 [Bipolaris maydis ATCC 48331]